MKFIVISMSGRISVSRQFCTLGFCFFMLTGGLKAVAVGGVHTRIINLRCEYRINPNAIDVTHPRFSWQMADTSRGAGQLAYRILVYEVAGRLGAKPLLVWDSKQINSSRCNAINYQGVTLKPRTAYIWKVIVTNIRRAVLRSAPASFQTGNFSLDDWAGSWIGYGNDKDTAMRAAPLFRKTFSLKGQPLHAEAYICGLGYYDLSLNGQKVGDHVLDPGYTNYSRTALYVKYDITDMLKTHNCAGIVLGNGWYNMQSRAVWYFDKAPWRKAPKVLLNIYITYKDGSLDTVVTDGSWQTATGSIIFNSLYSGEYVDDRLKKENWDTFGYQPDTTWKSVTIREPVSGTLKSQLMPTIKVQQTLSAVKFRKMDDTTYVYDFGQNFAGRSALTVSGPPGTLLKIKHGEVLTDSGFPDNEQIGRHMRFTIPGEAVQTDHFILNGRGQEVFCPRFTYHGFRYVEVIASSPVQLNRQSIVAQVLYTDLPRTGNFNCSNPLLNSIYSAGLWSYTSNLESIPTDCPQREKNGWTGDGQLACETGLYNYDGILLYEKWLQDFADEQQQSGALPGIIPTSGWGYDDYGPAWDSALILVPWYVYLHYGDDGLIRRYYTNFKRYIAYMRFRSTGHLVTWGLGDWIPYKSITPVSLTSTAYYYTDLLLMARYARLQGYRFEADNYQQEAALVKAAFRRQFYHPETHTYANGTQTALSAALFHDLVLPKDRGGVATALHLAVKQNDGHLDVGLLGSKFLLNALSENGYPETAYQIAAQSTYPSWGWWLGQGETTFQESWDMNKKSSRNHIMYGEIVAWFSKALAGIQVDEREPGFKNFRLKPCIIKELSFAGGSLETVYGKIESRWERTGAGVTYHVVVPANATARVCLPASAQQQVYLDGRAISGNRKFLSSYHRKGGETSFTTAAGQYDFFIR